MKKGLEEELKHRFDSFEPEVDAGLWEKISNRLDSPLPEDIRFPDHPTGNVPSLLKATWIKWGIAALVAGSLTVSGLLYIKSTGNAGEIPAGEKIEVPATKENKTTVEVKEADTPASSLASAPANNDMAKVPEPLNMEESVLSHPLEIPEEAQPKTTTSTPATTRIPPIVESVKTKEEAVNPDTGYHSYTEKVVSADPVLILSGKRGFAPFTVTAMTTHVDQQVEYIFGDGMVVERKGSATHTYDRPGTYRVSCKTEGKTLEETLEVIGEIPTAFSPNGDGVNDVFIIDNQTEAQLDFRIFDRSGRLVFSRKGTVIEWNGTLKNGENAEAGTYLYDIFATPEGGGSWKQKGTIHIFK